MSVFVWGSNKHKQLVGQGGLHCYAPALVSDEFEDQVPVQVAAGDEHVLVLCESGDVFSFGGGRDGQLGQGARFAENDGKVLGLENETVVHISAGAHTSFAVTSTGSVYHWGLVHVGDARLNDVATGHLHGMAGDQSVVVQPEADSRRERAEAAARNGSMRHMDRSSNDNRTRYLRDIVRESTERWMLPTEEAEFEYNEELRAMGYHVDEVEEMAVQRDEEHVNMLRMACRRQVHSLPVKIASLERRRIVSVSAGYAHVMALSELGSLYAAGYNDRGQLGLGHRINTSEFKPLEVMKNKFVVQVSCGQQHNICRAVDRAGCDESVYVGSRAGADAYVWGNGILGQLGLGRRGTTKGRMLPTLVPSLHAMFPSGIADVAAGANFSVVACVTGDVYSFGHAEYNQHGTGSHSNLDYVDPYHFFEPRKVKIRPTGSTTDVHVVAVSCGSVFTQAVDASGDLFSWGWNESGVLGHGFAHFSSSPQRVDGIGAHATGCKVAQVCCGAKHVVALAKHQGAPWATVFRQILQDPRHWDCVLVAESASRGLLGSGTVRLPCHRAVLAARSTYLRGFLRVAEAHAESSGAVELQLHGSHFNAVTLRCLLEYLYLDRASVPPHKRREVAEVARELLLPGLIRACFDPLGLSAQSPSTDFLADMAALCGSALYADVVCVASAEALQLSAELCGDRAPEVECLGGGWKMFAHRLVLSRIPYFEALLSGTFADCNVCLEVDGQTFRRLDVSGLVADGVDLVTLRELIQCAYWGCTLPPTQPPGDCALTPNRIMSLLAAASRVGYSGLAQVCERFLSTSLRFADEQDLRNCLDFATQFNLVRLERQCVDILRVLSVPLSEGTRSRSGTSSVGECAS